MTIQSAGIVKKTLSKFKRRFGLITQNRQTQSISMERDAEYYNHHYLNKGDEKAEYAKSTYYALWSIIVDRVRRDGYDRILEIGCGSGQLAAFLMDQGVKQYIGLDFSARAIDMARMAVPLGQFIVDDARSSTIYSEADYNIIICTEVLEHIEDDLIIVSRFPPGRRCICSVPSFEHDSHVRCFSDSGEVVARYGSFFHDLDVMTLKSPNWETDRFFLIDGIRNDHVVVV